MWNSSRMDNGADVPSDMDQSVFAVLTPCIDKHTDANYFYYLTILCTHSEHTFDRIR